MTSKIVYKDVVKEITDEQVQALFNACLAIRRGIKDSDYKSADAVDDILFGQTRIDKKSSDV